MSNRNEHTMARKRQLARVLKATPSRHKVIITLQALKGAT
jgi:hypothetical protein